MDYYAFLDTETGGLNAGQPILQIAWHIVASNNLTVKKESFYIEPKSWANVDDEALRVNGLWPDRLAELIEDQENKIEIEQACLLLAEDLKGYKAPLVAYNAPFDIKMILSNIDHKTAAKLPPLQKSKHSIDVMEPAKKALKSENWLSLVKAYSALTGQPASAGAHEANEDITMTRAVFFELENRGFI